MCLEAELANVRINHRGGLLEAAVEKDVAVGAGDQDRRQPVGADEVGVAVDLERLARLVPGLAVIALVRRVGKKSWRLRRRYEKEQDDKETHTLFSPKS